MRRATPAILATACLATAAPAHAQRPIAPGDVVPHLQALQQIADRNGGTRVAGRNGEVETVAMIASFFESLGWRVTRQPVPFLYWEERTPPVVHDLVPGRDFLSLMYSGSGEVTARVRRVREDGCGRRPNLRGLRRNTIAIVPPTCSFRVAALRLQRGGAAAVIFAAPRGRGPVIPGTLGGSGIRIPVVTVTAETGRRLSAIRTAIRVKVDAFTETRTGTNVIAERPGTNPREVIMAGGHLDSVSAGPGMNDNGSGVAALLEIGRRVHEMPLRDTVRLGFWSAEEWGVFGSKHYVQRLARRERREIGVYLNADMVGSPNGSPDVYDAHPTIERPLRRRLPGAGTSDFYADHTPFIEARIPSGGVFTGADDRKTRVAARRFGGRAGAPRDPCYHRSCDTIANVNTTLLARSANALAGAIVAWARR